MPIIFGGGSLNNLAIGGKKVCGIAKNGVLIYQHADDKFRQMILKNSVFHEGTPDFSQVATTDEGLWSMEDDYGISYYFRGAAENNYVKFASFYWRIIRINGDGSVRMIYDGTVVHKNGESSDDRFINNGKTTAFNTKYNDNCYVGYMYGKENSSSYQETHANTHSSTIKGVIDSWYEANIYNKGLDGYVTDVIYCNDRSIQSGTGTGTIDTYYGANARIANSGTHAPQFTCSQKNDAFTVNDTTKGNGTLTYPIGLITIDEIIAAGTTMIYGKDGSKNYYLYKSSTKRYWTLSPSKMVNLKASVYYEQNGYLSSLGTYNTYAVAPVISLKADLKMIGKGTMTDPYRLETETL